jgi:hypothetical protein
MFADDATTEVAQLQLHPELLAAVARPQKKAANDFRVDGWTPSLMERLARLLGLGRS